jgi:hypothetical protein
MRLLNKDELRGRFSRLPWLPEGAAVLVTPYTKVDMVGIAAFSYLMLYLEKSGSLIIDEKDSPRIQAMQLGKFIGPKNKPIKAVFLPDGHENIKSSIAEAGKTISEFRPEIITSLFRLTTTLGQKLREEAGLICRGLLRDELLRELSKWDMRLEWELEIPEDNLPILSFKVLRCLISIARVQIDTWSGTFLVNGKPSQKLFTSYGEFKEIILAQVDRYLEISTSPEQATG